MSAQQAQRRVQDHQEASETPPAGRSTREIPEITLSASRPVPLSKPVPPRGPVRVVDLANMRELT